MLSMAHCRLWVFRAWANDIASALLKSLVLAMWGVLAAQNLLLVVQANSHTHENRLYVGKSRLD